MSIREKWENFKSSVSQKIDETKQRAKDTFENHKGEIIAYGALGATLAGCLGAAIYQVGQNKKLDQEIKDTYGPNVIHWNVLGGTAPKRRADLMAWEEGERKERFDKMMAFAKELNVPDNEYYSIDRCIGPDGRMVTEICQTTGSFIHGEYF